MTKWQVAHNEQRPANCAPHAHRIPSVRMLRLYLLNNVVITMNEIKYASPKHS